MAKLRYSKIGITACLAVLVTSLQVQAQAVDMASASGVLADVAVAATQANTILADAATSGDADAVTKAQEQVETVKEAMQEAMQAYAEIGQATDDAGAEEAEASLNAALAKALGALGATPTSIPSPENENEGSDVINPYDVSWQSEGLRTIYQELFDIVESASSQGGSDFPENDATNI